jgi:hypothetical protein
MTGNLTALTITLILGTVAVIICLLKSGHFLKYLTLSAISGIGALFAVNLLTSLTGVSIALNYITLSVSALFGISGVIGLLLTF